MIVNRFTALYDCIKTKDTDIIRFFDNSDYRRYSTGGTATNLICYRQKEKDTIDSCKIEPQQLINNIIKNDGWESAANRLRGLLTETKLRQLFDILDSKDKTFKQAIIENDLYADFFADMPNCKVYIRQNDIYKQPTGRNRNLEVGKYSVFIEDKSQYRMTEIRFPNKSSKLLYLFFLNNPRMKISKKVIVQMINALYSVVYPNPEHNYNEDCRFSTSFKFTIDEFSDAKAKANNAVKKALAKIENTDNTEWYTIENDTKDDTYDISIFKEGIPNNFYDFNIIKLQ